MYLILTYLSGAYKSLQTLRQDFELTCLNAIKFNKVRVLLCMSSLRFNGCLTLLLCSSLFSPPSCSLSAETRSGKRPFTSS